MNEKERYEMRERVRTERKRDFARSGRQRDRVGVRERGLKERENRCNKKLIFSFRIVLQCNSKGRIAL